MATVPPRTRKNRLPPSNGATKKPSAEVQQSPDLLAQLMLQRRERVDRANAEIQKICAREKVALVVAGFEIVKGAIHGRINIVAADGA